MTVRLVLMMVGSFLVGVGVGILLAQQIWMEIED